MPPRPSSPARPSASRGKCLCSSHSSACGASSDWAKSRTASRIAARSSDVVGVRVIVIRCSLVLAGLALVAPSSAMRSVDDLPWCVWHLGRSSSDGIVSVLIILGHPSIPPVVLATWGWPRPFARAFTEWTDGATTTGASARPRTPAHPRTPMPTPRRATALVVSATAACALALTPLSAASAAIVTDPITYSADDAALALRRSARSRPASSTSPAPRSSPRTATACSS